MLGFPGIVVAELHIGMILYVMTISDLCSSDLTNGVTVRPGAVLRAELIILTGVESTACIARLLQIPYYTDP